MSKKNPLFVIFPLWWIRIIIKQCSQVPVSCLPQSQLLDTWKCPWRPWAQGTGISQACPALCCSSLFPLPLLNHPMPGAREQFSSKCWSLTDLSCISANRRHLVLATFSSLCCISGRECYARIYAFSFPQTTCYLSALPVTYRAFICTTSPLWQGPFSSQVLYIITGNCVFAMAAQGPLVTSSILLFRPQGMESWWVV